MTAAIIALPHTPSRRAQRQLIFPYLVTGTVVGRISEWFVFWTWLY